MDKRDQFRLICVSHKFLKWQSVQFKNIIKSPYLFEEKTDRSPYHCDWLYCIVKTITQTIDLIHCHIIASASIQFSWPQSDYWNLFKLFSAFGSASLMWLFDVALFPLKTVLFSLIVTLLCVRCMCLPQMLFKIWPVWKSQNEAWIVCCDHHCCHQFLLSTFLTTILKTENSNFVNKVTDVPSDPHQILSSCMWCFLSKISA